MHNITSFPCIKLNLGLNVVSKREDGYHNLETVFYPVAIHDELKIEQKEDAPGTCKLTVLGVDNLCEPEKNLVVKAYRLLSKYYDLPAVSITLNKLLPSQAGLGGGSSDAAYTITSLNKLFNLGLTVEEMQRYAAQLGADCAFFITSEPAYATGIGDKLQPCEVKALDGKYIALIKPNVAVSTKEAYAGITPHQPKKNCLEVIQQPIETWREELHNDFEDSIFPLLPELRKVKEYLYDNGALYAAMSGSGSTVFGIFDKDPKEIINNYATDDNTFTFSFYKTC